MTSKAQAKRDKPHYVNNAEFSAAVVEYVKSVRLAREEKIATPIVTNYIAACFLRIAEGLSHKGNFVRYTYREEMVMDAVENCLKAIENYNLEVATRTGKPNAFAYFTQIAWYAFLRRIQKEKKQQDIKLKYLAATGLEHLVAEGGDQEALLATQAFVDSLKERIEKVKEFDAEVVKFSTEPAKRTRRKSAMDSDLQGFFVEQN